MFENDLNSVVSPVGAVQLPTAVRVGARTQALSGSKPRLSMTSLVTMDDPSVVSIISTGF
jgi:hypothetical protein